MMRVSLKNLHEATAQEVFDQVAKHLLQQGQESMLNGCCKYHLTADDGTELQCAAGCLIADDEYNPEWESMVWHRLVTQGSVPAVHSELIDELQSIHDSVNPYFWQGQLLRVAMDYNLSVQKVMANVASFNERI